MNRSALRLRLSPASVGWFLAAVILLPTLVSVVGQVCRYTINGGRVTWWVLLFDLNNEDNIPAYYQGLTIWICTVLLALIAVQEFRHREPFRFHWAGLSFIFQLLSIDEMCALHEQLAAVMKKTGYNFHLIWQYTWVIPAIAIVAVVGLIYLRFVWRLPRSVRLRVIAAGIIYIAGAVGMEMVGGWYEQWHGGTNNLACQLLANLEELMEMSGIALFIVTLLSYMAEWMPKIMLDVRTSPTLDEQHETLAARAGPWLAANANANANTGDPPARYNRSA